MFFVLLKYSVNDNKKNDKNDKKRQKYSCEYCDFTTCKKTDYTRHCLTQKRQNNVLTTDHNGKNDKAYTCKMQ